MRICAAQTKPITGDIPTNIERHLSLIDIVLTNGGADAIIFSELSLTGYEPTLAKKLATDANDPRLTKFQDISDKVGITIGAGLPTINGHGFSISMILFQPDKPRQLYSKKYLHPDEDEFFIPGKNIAALPISETTLGIAICYELSIPEHSAAAHKAGADVYVASVAKFAKGVEHSLPTLAGIAAKYSMSTVMVNAVGPADNGICTGNSSVWDNKGQLLDQLDNVNEGILIFDTTTGEITKRQI